jgi:hypothetical protein
MRTRRPAARRSQIWWINLPPASEHLRAAKAVVLVAERKLRQGTGGGAARSRSAWSTGRCRSHGLDTGRDERDCEPSDWYVTALRRPGRLTHYITVVERRDEAHLYPEATSGLDESAGSSRVLWLCHLDTISRGWLVSTSKSVFGATRCDDCGRNQDPETGGDGSVLQEGMNLAVVREYLEPR